MMVVRFVFLMFLVYNIFLQLATVYSWCFGDANWSTQQSFPIAIANFGSVVIET